MATTTYTPVKFPNGDSARALGSSINDYRLVINKSIPKQHKTTRYDLTECLIDVSLSDSFDQPAQTLEATVSAQSIRSIDGRAIDVREILSVGAIVSIYASTFNNDGGLIPIPSEVDEEKPYPQANLLFYGFVFSYSMSSAATGDSIQITAYDPLIYLSRNMYDKPFVSHKKKRPRGWRADEIIRSVCGHQGLKLKIDEDHFVNTKVYIKRVVTIGLSLYDTCILALEKTYNQGRTKRKYTFRYHPAKGVQLLPRKIPTARGKGTSRVWHLSSETNLLSANYTKSIENLVTAVTVKTDGKKGRKQIGGTYRNRSMERLYGSLHQIVDIQSPGTLEEAVKARNALLKDQGKPQETIDVSVPCINQFRAGDGVWVTDDDTGFDNLFWISAVTHSISSASATSDLTLVREPSEIDYPEVQDPAQNPSRSSYVIVKDANGKSVEFAVTYRVVDIVKDARFHRRGSVFSGDESVAVIKKGSRLAQLCTGSEPQFLIQKAAKGKQGATAGIVDTYGGEAGDVLISLSVAQAAELGHIGSHGTAYVKPKRARIGGKASGRSRVMDSAEARRLTTRRAPGASVRNSTDNRAETVAGALWVAYLRDATTQVAREHRLAPAVPWVLMKHLSGFRADKNATATDPTSPRGLLLVDATVMDVLANADGAWRQAWGELDLDPTHTYARAKQSLMPLTQLHLFCRYATTRLVAASTSSVGPQIDEAIIRDWVNRQLSISTAPGARRQIIERCLAEYRALSWGKDANVMPPASRPNPYSDNVVPYRSVQ